MDNLETIDKLRLDAAIKATELAMAKWERIAFGVEKTKDHRLLSFASVMWASLHRAIISGQKNART